MDYKLSQNDYISPRHKGIVLLFTLVFLVVMAAFSYTLTTKVRAQRSRDRYIVDYQSARYGCDSAVKYVGVAISELNFGLVSRPNEPDFSDLFSLTDEEYQQLIELWEAELNYSDNDSGNNYENKTSGFGTYDEVGIADYAKQFGELFGFASETAEPNVITIRGPYGPQWPYVAEPILINIGTAEVKIEVIDENSKYPIGWALIEDENIRNEAVAGFISFCEWMNVDRFEIEQLLSDLDEIRGVKEFHVEFGLTRQASESNEPAESSEPAPPAANVAQRPGAANVRAPATKEIPVNTHIADFARLFNSSIIDASVLKKAAQLSDDRQESVLKYTSLWPAGKININTAPRHVLEAAFIFGGDQVNIADEIIVARRQKPFKDIDELRKTLFEYSNSIAKCEKFITTESDFFTVEITAVSGAAKSSSVVAVKKTGRGFAVIAAISD